MTSLVSVPSPDEVVDEVDCSFCDTPIKPEVEDGETALDCGCGNWHHYDCAPACSEYVYWLQYSAEEDRASDERGGGW